MFNRWLLNYSSTSSRANALLESLGSRHRFIRAICLTWAGRRGCFRCDHLFRNSPDSFRPLYHEGVWGRESWNRVTWPKLAFQFLFCFTFTLQYDNSSTEQKNVFLCVAFKSESRCEHSISVFPHHYLHSCSGESEGVSQESLDFCLEGELF